MHRVLQELPGHLEYSVAESWLSIQLFELAEFSKVRNGMEPADFIELARTIILGYGRFKLTEFMVFFQRFKQDKYDQFYQLRFWQTIDFIILE